MLVNIDHLNFAYGINEIFKDAQFQIKEKERVGLVGPNGSGKSTFIKLLTKQLEPDSGTITIDSNITLGHLEQEINFDQNLTLNELFNNLFKDYQAQEERLRELEHLIAESDQKELNYYLREYDKLQEYFRRENIYSYESRIRGMINGLKLSKEELEKPFNTLSGGQKTRVILAMILLRTPDLLILDEPTNYLDIQTLGWLEKTLINYEGSVLLISHDRYFLNQVCNRIVEIENYKLNSYSGNYDEYADKKEVELAQQNRLYLLTLQEVERQKKIIRRYRDVNSKQSSKHARSREKALAKIKLPPKVEQKRDILFYFNPRLRSGDEVLKVKNLSKSFDDKLLFSNINFLINRNDKVGIIGKNGIGKTTLFNILRKRLKQDSGSIDYGAKVNYAFFDQESEDLREYEDLNLIEVIRESNINMSDGEIRDFLATFQFREEDVFKQVKDLSGGEKVRIKLAQLMLSKANFLIMDEPTNHIDMATKEILENVLINYQGTLLYISHDRYFLNKISNRIFEFTKDGINEYLGNYEDYVQKTTQKEISIENSKKRTTKTQRDKERKKDRDFKKNKAKLLDQINKIEKEIETKENRITEIENQMGLTDFYKLESSKEVIQEYNKLKEEVPELTEKWEELSLDFEELTK